MSRHTLQHYLIKHPANKAESNNQVCIQRHEGVQTHTQRQVATIFLKSDLSLAGSNCIICANLLFEWLIILQLNLKSSPDETPEFFLQNKTSSQAIPLATYGALAPFVLCLTPCTCL